MKQYVATRLLTLMLACLLCLTLALPALAAEGTDEPVTVTTYRWEQSGLERIALLVRNNMDKAQTIAAKVDMLDEQGGLVHNTSAGVYMLPPGMETMIMLSHGAPFASFTYTLDVRDDRNYVPVMQYLEYPVTVRGQRALVAVTNHGDVPVKAQHCQFVFLREGEVVMSDIRHLGDAQGYLPPGHTQWAEKTCDVPFDQVLVFPQVSWRNSNAPAAGNLEQNLTLVKSYTWKYMNTECLALVVRNDSAETVDAVANVGGFDASGALAGALNMWQFAVPAGGEFLLFANPKEAFAQTEYSLTAKPSDSYLPVVQDLATELNTLEKKVVVSITNKGSIPAYSVVANLLLMKDGQPVNYLQVYPHLTEMMIRPGATAAGEVPVRDAYDEVLVYLTGHGRQ